MSDSRVLLLDIETSPLLVTAWRLFNKAPLGYENIVKESYIILACWQWLGEKSVQSAVSPRVWDDKPVVNALKRVLAEADAVVAHNGKKFDLPIIRARALKHGHIIQPNFVEIDTLQLARRGFRFNSNRLDYLGEFLGVGRKKRTEYNLWLKVIDGDQDALEEMRSYCEQDVRLLGRVFERLRPYLPPATCRQLFGKIKCGRCGSRHLVRRGKRVDYTQYQCQECGGYRSEPD